MSLSRLTIFILTFIKESIQIIMHHPTSLQNDAFVRNIEHKKYYIFLIAEVHFYEHLSDIQNCYNNFKSEKYDPMGF